MAKYLNADTKIELRTVNEVDQTQVNEFFTAKFVNDGKNWNINLTKTSTEVELSGDLETQVVIKITDKFGDHHEVEALTFTMKKEHAANK